MPTSVIFDRQALLKQHGSQKRRSLHISPSAYQAGKERMGVENTVVSIVEIKKASEIDTSINPGLWKD
jgi:hypothetical protein